MGLLGAGDDGGVAAGFAFAADPGRNEPDGRVEEQQRFDDPLGEVHDVVVAADMSQFVQQDHFDFIGAPAGDGGGREQDHRPNDADEDRRGHALAHGDRDAAGDAAGDAERRGEAGEGVSDGASGNRSTSAAEAMSADETGEEQRERKWRADEPEPGEVGDESGEERGARSERVEG